MAIQAINHPSISPSIKSLSLHLSGKNVAGDHSKGCTRVQVTPVPLPLSTDAVTPLWDVMDLWIDQWIGQVQFALGEGHGR